MDISPKVFEVIILGAIPIVVHGPLDDAYQQLPVAFVDDAISFLSEQNKTNSMNLMYQWEKTLAPYYYANSVLRNQTLYRCQINIVQYLFL